ncbi:MAG: thiamine-phosphate kinase [Candidatus Bathyarchaeia archaeon]
MKRTEKLGERKIIQIIQSHLDLMPKMPVPFGDDVSACDIGNGNLAILKTDMLVSKTDVPPGMTLWQAARKAVVMNISDFAAKGVKPKAMLVSLGLPKGMGEKAVEELAGGLNAGAREYGAYVIGGDTGEASDLVISLSLFGTATKSEVILRSGARPGDFLAVTGFFGKTSAGLKILLHNLDVPKKLRKVLVESVLLPRARLKEGLALRRAGAVSAAIDSSDGLAWSLHEVARASNVGFTVDKLPIAREAERFAEDNNIDPVELALYGGEEYEIILTVKPSLWSAAEKAVRRARGRLLQIGTVTAKKSVLFKTNGKKRIIRPRGYEHFET